jgi:hypothetical protein
MQPNDPTKQQPGASIDELARSASLIFSGTVVKLGASEVSLLPAREHFAVIQVDRGLRAEAALGELRGRLITMARSAPGDLRQGQKAVFFTHSWIHGKQIAVQEVTHLDAQSEDAVAQAIAGLPGLHLKDRLRSAQRIVLAEVSEIRSVPKQRRTRLAPFWSVAVLKVVEALRGGAEPVEVLFPTSTSRHWIRAPRFQPNQRGIFLLHENAARAANWLDGTAGVWTALDPADVQPEARLGEIKSLLV